MTKAIFIKDLKLFLFMTILAFAFNALVKGAWLDDDMNWAEETIHWSLFSAVMTFLINHTHLFDK